MAQMKSDIMRHRSFGTIRLLTVCVLVSGLALSEVPGKSGTLSVSGYPGQVPIVQINGRSYVEIESSARQWLYELPG